jgi:hypothetical protein
MTCRPTHHLACDCREQKFAVLIKAALDLAAEVDVLKAAAAITLNEKARILEIVERAYDACEQVQPRKVIGCKRVDGGADCLSHVCDLCDLAIHEVQP